MTYSIRTEGVMVLKNRQDGIKAGNINPRLLIIHRTVELKPNGPARQEPQV
ncbi:hypothetical protein [Pacificibacter maritimus]|uniref:hypothetical protein n=1 Tax=Pacificibacter maritimus TaxID=762213 RepID=UPI001475A326|nr:hypothetical protein [Pacificibacter maritimus]